MIEWSICSRSNHETDVLVHAGGVWASSKRRFCESTGNLLTARKMTQHTDRAKH